MAVPAYIDEALRRSPRRIAASSRTPCLQIGGASRRSKGSHRRHQSAMECGTSKRAERPADGRGFGDEQAWDHKRRYFERRTYRYFTHWSASSTPVEHPSAASIATPKSAETRRRLARCRPVGHRPAVDGGAEPERPRPRLFEDGSTVLRTPKPQPQHRSCSSRTARSVVTPPRWRRCSTVCSSSSGGSATSARVCSAEKCLGKQLIGWSTILSNSPLNSGQRGALAEHIGQLYRNGC